MTPSIRGRYDSAGRMIRGRIDAALPPNWTWSGRRALDFGCGVGRVIGQYAPEAADCELWGCDIDAPSVAWMRRHLEPPFHPFLVGERPPLPQPDGFFDLVCHLRSPRTR